MLRNRQLMRTLLLAPLIQLIILPLAADYSVKNIAIAVTDNDHSTTSRRLIEKIVSSGYFKLKGYVASYKEGLTMVEQDKADLEKNLAEKDKQGKSLQARVKKAEAGARQSDRRAHV